MIPIKDKHVKYYQKMLLNCWGFYTYLVCPEIVATFANKFYGILTTFYLSNINIEHSVRRGLEDPSRYDTKLLWGYSFAAEEKWKLILHTI